MNYSMSILRTALATLATVALVGPSAQAQSSPSFTTLFPGQPRVSIGALAGLSYSTLAGDDIQEKEYLAGFSGGLYATLNINPILALQTEAMYVQKGAKTDPDGATPFGDGEQTIRINTVEVPLLLRAAVPVRSAARPYVYGGPSMAFTVSASREFDDGTLGEGDDLLEDEGFEDSVRDMNYGLIFGGGLDLRLPVAGKATLDARYSLALTDVFEEDAQGVAPDLKHNTFQLTLGFGL